MDMSTLNVRDVRTFIGAKDFDASRDFYLALGWTQTYDADDLRVLQLGGHRFYLQNYYQKDWCENTMLHISVDDVEAWFAHVRAVFAAQTFKDARMSGSIEDAGYGNVFYVWDPSGALLHFAQFK